MGIWAKLQNGFSRERLRGPSHAAETFFEFLPTVIKLLTCLKRDDCLAGSGKGREGSRTCLVREGGEGHTPISSTRLKKEEGCDLEPFTFRNQSYKFTHMVWSFKRLILGSYCIYPRGRKNSADMVAHVIHPIRENVYPWHWGHFYWCVHTRKLVEKYKHYIHSIPAQCKTTPPTVRRRFPGVFLTKPSTHQFSWQSENFRAN